MKTAFWSRLWDCISPRRCGVCGCRLAVCEESLCTVCLLHLPRTYFWLSPQDNKLARQFWGLLPVERAASWFFYEPHSETGRLVYDLKYHSRPETGVALGRIMASELESSRFFSGIDCLIPVPLSRKRQRSRGYNQSERIACGLSEVTSIPVCAQAVKRVHFRHSQTRLDRWQRMENVNRMFRLTGKVHLEDKHILLIDDIATTGATLTACGEVFQKISGVKISILTLGFSKS